MIKRILMSIICTIYRVAARCTCVLRWQSSGQVPISPPARRQLVLNWFWRSEIAKFKRKLCVQIYLPPFQHKRSFICIPGFGWNHLFQGRDVRLIATGRWRLELLQSIGCFVLCGLFPQSFFWEGEENFCLLSRKLIRDVMPILFLQLNMWYITTTCVILYCAINTYSCLFVLINASRMKPGKAGAARPGTKAQQTGFFFLLFWVFSLLQTEDIACEYFF